MSWGELRPPQSPLLPLPVDCAFVVDAHLCRGCRATSLSVAPPLAAHIVSIVLSAHCSSPAEIFRCNLATPTDDCTDKQTTNCISEALYQGITDGIVSSGLAAAGYASIHMDDCWPQMNPPRDPTTNELVGDKVRFKSGMAALGQYIHAAGLSFALYTSESVSTCGGYPGSENNEVLDAQTFASWGVSAARGHFASRTHAGRGV